MEIMKPYAVDDDTLIISSIPEPDPSQGEVEWVNTYNPQYIANRSGTISASVLADNGNIYMVGFESNGDLIAIELNPSDDSIIEFGSGGGGTYDDGALGNDGNIYFVGAEGKVLKIDPDTRSFTTFGTYTDRYHAAAKGSDGNIYCVSSGSARKVLKIDVDNQTVSEFGLYNNIYYAAVTGSDGNIYCVGSNLATGDPGKVMKIDIPTQTIEEFGEYTGIYDGGTLGEDGKIYMVGRWAPILTIDTESKALSVFGSPRGRYKSAALSTDGFIYSSSDIDVGIKIDTENRTTEQFQKNQSVGENTATIDDSGNIYFAGNERYNISKIIKPYNIGDETILTSTHKIYKSAALTRDNPTDGVDLATPSWVEQRYTNKYRMFNDAKDSKSVSDSDIFVDFKFPNTVTTIATLGVVGTSVRVVVAEEGGAIIYDEEKQTADAGVNDFWPWFFQPYDFREDLVFQGIPAGYLNTSVKVEVKSTAGNPAVGLVLCGSAQDIGITNVDTRVGRQNFSTRSRNDFGDLTIESRRSIKVVNYDITVERTYIDNIDRLLSRIRGEAALFIGEGDTESLICYGVSEDPSMPMGVEISTMNLEVKEI